MSWRAVYAGYDDEALAAAANPGLLRRAAKDVEAGKVRWLEQGADGAAVEADGQTVRVDGRGLPGMRCGCPAAEICKHRLAAALWLRAQAIEAGAPAVSALQDLLALDPAAVFKRAGRVTTRAAAALLTDSDARAELSEQAGALLIAVPALEAVVRYLPGAGVDGMISDTPERRRPAVHLAALVAAWRACGRAVDWPEGIVEAESPRAGLSEAESACIDRAERLALELVAHGLAHVSAIGAERWRAFATSARAEGLPRLAGMLRTLSGSIDRLEARDPDVDSGEVLFQLARLYAWCRSIRGADGERLSSLRGTARRDESGEAEALELLPLGAWWWENPSGACGLSLALWNAEGGGILHAVQARPNRLDPNFGRRQAWSVNPLWPGAGSVERLCREGVRLERPRLTDGQIALGGDTRAQSRPAWSSGDPRLQDAGERDWEALAAELARSQGLLGSLPRSVLLRPAAVLPLELDEIGQRLRLTLKDAAGRGWTLSLPCAEDFRARGENLEGLLARYPLPQGGLASVHPAGHGFELRPVALLIDDGGEVRSLSLDFVSAPKPPVSLTGRILRLLRTRQARAGPATEAPSLAVRLAAPLESWLETLAATGRSRLSDADRARLAAVLRRLEGCGLHGVAEPVREALERGSLPPEELLRLRYLVGRLATL